VTRNRWTRPYSRGWFSVILGFLYVVGALIGAGLLISASGGTDRGLNPGGLIATILFLMIWLGGLTRVAMLGIYVGSSGLRYRGPIRTITIRWADVKEVRLESCNIRWIGSAVRAKYIWIARNNAEPISTMLNDKGVDFLGRHAAFERAFEDISAAVQSHQ